MSDQKTGRGLYWLATAAAAVALLLAIANIVLILSNQSLQMEAARRQQNVTGMTRLLQINRELVLDLVNHAVANKDQTIINMLQQHGVTFKVNNPADNAAPSTPAPTKK